MQDQRLMFKIAGRGLQGMTNRKPPGSCSVCQAGVEMSDAQLPHPTHAPPTCGLSCLILPMAHPPVASWPTHLWPQLPHPMAHPQLPHPTHAPPTSGLSCLILPLAHPRLLDCISLNSNHVPLSDPIG